MALPKCLDEPPIILQQKMCLNAVSKNLKGNFKPTAREKQSCARPECKTLKTVHALRMKTQSNPPCDSPLSKSLEGEFVVERLVTAYEVDGNNRGFHAGDFVWKSMAATIAGRISGMTNVGTHRAPVFQPACQKCDTRGVMEGRLCGQVVETQNPELKDCHIVGSYRIKFDPSVGGGAGQTVSAVIEAELICRCD
jgi:hypothetical protein